MNPVGTTSSRRIAHNQPLKPRGRSFLQFSKLSKRAVSTDATSSERFAFPARASFSARKRFSLPFGAVQRFPALRASIAGVNPEASGSDAYWKDGFYTNWTYGKLLDDRKALENSSPDPQAVINKSKGILRKAVDLFAAMVKAIALTIVNPMRLPRGIASVCGHLKHELVHYWQGLQLLFADVSTASRLLKAFITTGKLSWREKRQLSRTLADVFRLVPMAVFLLVPLFEFLLPIALKLFPEMLPSQFHKKDLQEAQLKKELKFRLRTAAFLQDTINGIVKSKQLKDEADLVRLLDDVRAGKRVSNADIMQIAHLFDDELTLDNLDHMQLASLCRMIGVRPLGPTQYLRKKLKTKLRALKDDDVEIMKVGVENLDVEELMSACRERGMRTLGLTKEGYRRNLKQWLSLSLESDIPASLLLLSRAFVLLERNPNPEEALRAALENVDEECVKEILYDAGVTMDAQQKLELIKEQNELIKKDHLEDEKVKIKDIAPPEDDDREKNRIGQATAGSVEGGFAQTAAVAGVLGKLELIESANRRQEIPESELRQIAEELEGLLDDPFTSEKETLRRLMENTGASPDEATGRIRAAVSKARAAADEKPNMTVAMTSGLPQQGGNTGNIPSVVVENAPFEFAGTPLPEEIIEGVKKAEKEGIQILEEEQPNIEKKETKKDPDSVLEERLKGRLRNVLNRIEKRMEKMEKVCTKDEKDIVLDLDKDGKVSQEEIVNVLTNTLIEFEGHPEEAEKVAKTLAQKCGDLRGEVSVQELLALAKKAREEEMGD